MANLFYRSSSRPLSHPALRDALSRLHNREREAPLKWKVRASALPLCSRFYAFHIVFHGIGKYTITKTDRFILDITAEAGTHVHAVYQKWLARAGVLFGDYECPSCNIVHYDRVGPIKCMGCGKECVYDELSVADSVTGYTGHLDGLIPVDTNDYSRGFILADIKTGKEQDVEPSSGSVHRLTGLSTEFYNRVWKKWMWQISTYVYWISKRKVRNVDGTTVPLKIVGCAIIVVNRGRPWRNRLIFTQDYEPEKYEVLVDDVLYTEHRVRKFVISSDPKHVTSLDGACRDEEEGSDCAYVAFCFSRRLDKELLEAYHGSDFYKEDQKNRLLRTRISNTTHLEEFTDPLIRILRGFSK